MRKINSTRTWRRLIHITGPQGVGHCEFGFHMLVRRKGPAIAGHAAGCVYAFPCPPPVKTACLHGLVSLLLFARMEPSFLIECACHKAHHDFFAPRPDAVVCGCSGPLTLLPKYCHMIHRNRMSNTRCLEISTAAVPRAKRIQVGEIPDYLVPESSFAEIPSPSGVYATGVPVPILSSILGSVTCSIEPCQKATRSRFHV